MYYGYELRFTEKLFNFMFEITIPFLLLLLNLFYHRHVELFKTRNQEFVGKFVLLT